ncbi:MAG: hypothetical protein FWF36_00305 [Propionibacteriaceae bacterium]|nr:hypothetical protein [Propionibacteriaceae bacterium]
MSSFIASLRTVALRARINSLATGEQTKNHSPRDDLIRVMALTRQDATL